ncbi:MAG: sigma-70 family RNA polymerase sigma factor [Pirellulales bacterium]
MAHQRLTQRQLVHEPRSGPWDRRSSLLDLGDQAMEARSSEVTIMQRTNESWIACLAGDSTDREPALSDLRILLLRGLRRSFADRPHADESLLEDVIQEALLRVLDRIGQFEGRSQFLTWAITIAIRVAYTELRRRHWKDVSLDQILEDTAHGDLQTVVTSTRPEAATKLEALIEDMYRIIDTDLTKKQRTALLAELKGMPLEEIGRRMGSNRNAIYKLTHDARKRLKQGLEAAGYSVDDLQTV